MPSLLRACALTLAIVLLAGCSFTRLGYQNLDWLLSWKLNDYVSLNREQKRWLSRSVDRHLAWHCSNELPRYQPMLLTLRDELLAGEPDPGQLNAQFPLWQAEVERVLEEISPTIADFFLQLDDEQIQDLLANLAEQQQELHERYVAPAPGVQNRQRSERMQKRLAAWLGRLSNGQKALIDQWAVQLNGQNAIWLENRQQWQEQLRTVLEQRHEQAFESRLTALLLTPESTWTQAYLAQRTHGMELAANLLSEVMGMATPRQKHRLERRASGLLRDIESIQCPAGKA